VWDVCGTGQKPSPEVLRQKFRIATKCTDEQQITYYLVRIKTVLLLHAYYLLCLYLYVDGWCLRDDYLMLYCVSVGVQRVGAESCCGRV
jgi:hypothetical protein